MSERNSSGAIGDPGRLDALRRLGLLDGPRHAGFDRLTRIVRRSLNVPISLVTLIEQDRQFFLSAMGLPEPIAADRQTPLTHSFCQHVVETGAALRVEHAAEHPLVRHNKALELGVVAYLGMPLRSRDGFVLGALCAIDTAPRAWTAAEEGALADLAALASTELALRELAIELDTRVQREVAALAAAEAELGRKRRLEVLGQLAGGVAHDFANVLQTVQAGVRLATNNLTRDPAKAQQMLDRVADAAKRGGSVTRRLLGFARRGELRIEPVDPSEMLVDLQQVLTQTLNQPGLQVALDVELDLPKVLADRGELETVLVNLATNARDAMPKGGTLTLGARLEQGAAAGRVALRAGRYLAFSARDTGVGMSAETLARASEPFFTTKPDGEGTGLGLSMARDFAVQAGGGFEIQSEPGAGTKVTLWLPCADAA